MSRSTLVLSFAALAALAFPTLTTVSGAARQDAADPAAALVKKLKDKSDASEPKLIQDLAGLRTRAAMEGLLDVYKSMNTIFMRREVLRAFVLFDGVPDAEQPALQKLMDVATQAPEPELRRAALDGLGQCRTHGKDFLRLIVESPAEDSVREHAMELHVINAGKDDQAWYREVYKPKIDEKAEKERDKKDKKDTRKEQKNKDKDADPKKDAPKKVRRLPTLRWMAFGALLKDLSADEVAEAIEDPYHQIRRDALLELERRGDKRTLDLATDAYQKITPLDSTNMVLKTYERVEVRIVAVQIVGRLSGTKMAADFIKRATNVETPMELRRAIAEVLAGFNDNVVNQKLLGELGKGRTHEKLFTLWAVSKMQGEKVDQAIEKLLVDRDPDIVVAACNALAERKAKGIVPNLQRLTRSKDRNIIRAALDAMAVVRVGDPTWMDELVAFTKSDDPELRNLALQQMGQTSDKAYLPKLLEALNDKNWSVRLAALEALEHLHMKEAISAIIVRMADEEGRMKDEFATALWRMTGQPYQDDAKAWDNWWKQFGPSFQILSDEDLKRVKSGEEEWRLKQTTRVESKFFGIRIISHRVIFIIDISGSMNEELHGEYEGKSGQSRMEIAKRELVKSVQSLDPSALFNLVVFSSDVNRWIDGSLAAANEANRNKAKEYVEKLGAGGGTNLYGAIKEAFADPDVDTIFIMSDGEPSVGDETDQLVIREHVKQWNEHRGIVINTVAIGGQFQILEWLAEDSGGTSVKFE